MDEPDQPIAKTFFDVELVDQAFADIAAFGTQLEASPTTTVWFRNLLISLLSALLREHRSLSVGLKKSTPLVAWACRNMLELNICTKYALLKGSNARDFVDDMWTDSIEVFVASRAWLLFHDPKRHTSDLDEIIATLGAGKAQHGNTRPRYLDIREMANAVNFGDEYRHIKKVTSKLVYQTALAVLVSPADGLQYLRKVLFDNGVRFAVEAFSGIRQYVETNGVEPLA